MDGWVLCELFRLFDRRFAFWVCSGWSLFGFASLYWVERFCLCVCVCVKRTNGEEGVASRMQLPGHQM
jgi:hypothetical protein